MRNHGVTRILTNNVTRDMAETFLPASVHCQRVKAKLEPSASLLAMNERTQRP